jgi:uncharacterized membrane protein YkgB
MRSVLEGVLLFGLALIVGVLLGLVYRWAGLRGSWQAAVASLGTIAVVILLRGVL